MTDDTWITVNGERLEGATFEFRRDDCPPKMLYLKLDPNVMSPSIDHISKMGPASLWYEFLSGETLIGWCRDFEIMGYDRLGICNPVRARFYPAEAFFDIADDVPDAAGFREVVFLYDAAKKCREIHFVRKK